MVALSAVAFLAQPANAGIDVYITPGKHNVNGRQWNTTCERYSSTVTRCRTDIYATQISLKNGRYVSTNGWVFNNLTYKASPRTQWSNNNLGKNAEWTSADGRRWYTQCDTPTTGRNGCRSYIWGTAISAKASSSGTTYVQQEGWQFNNMVRFTNDVYATYSGTGPKTITLPRGATELYVIGTHRGESNFMVHGLDSGNRVTDYVINEIGTTRGAGAVGIYDDDTTKLDVEADGHWTLVVKPLSAAPTLTASGLSGRGSDILWYYGPARSFTLTHDGESNFIVSQETAEDYRGLVNEIGAYSASRPFLAGPSLIELMADGNWSIR